MVNAYWYPTHAKAVSSVQGFSLFLVVLVVFGVATAICSTGAEML